MIIRISYLIVILLLFYSCVNQKNTNPEFSNIENKYEYQEFDIKLFKGKWLTNSKNDIYNFRIFQENNYMLDSDNRNVSYTLQKDSIKIYFNDKTAKGRLLNLNEKEVTIIWGNLETITYYRP